MRLWLWIIFVVVVLGAGIGIYMLTPVTGPARDLTLTGNAERGAYLIRLGGCVTCHTDRKNKEALLAGLQSAGLKTPFGSFFPPNITSSKSAGIGNWTLAQFASAMSDGEGPQGHLYPAFPFDAYTLMSDQEIADLFAALQAVPAIDTPSHPHEVGFPFNIRLAMAGWKHLFFHPQRFVADPAHSEQWNRGKYIVFGPGHCVTCHSPRNLLGGIDAGRELTGNPAGGTGGKTPSLLKEALAKHEYDAAALAQTLGDGFTPGFDTLGSVMAEVIADETSQWTEADRAAVAAYLTGGE
ncbi:MAG: cytochrome c [Devosia sp.]|nr:cytochrome c [Devosia sp.]